MKIRVTSKLAPVVMVTTRKARTIDPVWLARALGAERVPEHETHAYRRRFRGLLGKP